VSMGRITCHCTPKVCKPVAGVWSEWGAKRATPPVKSLAKPLPCPRQRGAEASRRSGSMSSVFVPPHRVFAVGVSSPFLLKLVASGGGRPACAYLFYRSCLEHTEGVQASSVGWSEATPHVQVAAKPLPCCRRPKRRRLAGAVSAFRATAPRFAVGASWPFLLKLAALWGQACRLCLPLLPALIEAHRRCASQLSGRGPSGGRSERHPRLSPRQSRFLAAAGRSGGVSPERSLLRLSVTSSLPLPAHRNGTPHASSPRFQQNS
jgi:hypothetical protein